MALTDVSDGSRVIEFGVATTKVTLSRACKVGDILGVASDNYDDLGPAYSAAAAHSTAATYFPRFVAGQAGAAGDVITAYGIATVTGYSSGAVQSLVYMAQTSGTAGQISETAPTGTGSCASIIGTTVATNRVILFPMSGSPVDTKTTA